MEFLRNIQPYEVIDPLSFVKHSGNRISSKAIIDKEELEIRFFSASKGEEIDKEYYIQESIFHCLSGSMKIVYKENDEVILNPGDMFVLESNVPYGIKALEDVKYYNILIKL